MLKNLGNLGQMMKQAQEMQGKVQEMQEKLQEVEVMGVSAAGMVSVRMNGKREISKLDIDPSLINADEKEVMEDLIVAALNDAIGKVEAMVQEKTQEMMGGVQLPQPYRLHH